MNTNRLILWLLAVTLGWFTTPSRSAQVEWKTSRAQAVETARNSGKLILLLAGRDTCGNCQYMKGTVCESASIKPTLTGNFVAWYCPVDSSTEWHAYASGLGSFTLPLICVIEPGSPTRYLDRTTSVQSTAAFRTRLFARLPTQPITLSPTSPDFPRVAWVTETQCQYRVLRSTDLAHWSFVGEAMAGNGTALEFEDGSGAARGFYRVIGFR